MHSQQGRPSGPPEADACVRRPHVESWQGHQIPGGAACLHRFLLGPAAHVRGQRYEKQIMFLSLYIWQYILTKYASDVILSFIAQLFEMEEKDLMRDLKDLPRNRFVIVLLFVVRINDHMSFPIQF